MEHELKNLFRKWFKENGFTKKTDTEFIVYIKEKLELVRKVVSGRLDDEFIKYTISREDLRASNIKNLIPHIQEKYTKMFYDVRVITVNKEKELSNLDNSLNSIKNI